MSKIELLPAHVAERIAAGEVVERPASVVKELVENALDAQASSIEIKLEEGGKKLIEVTDNGCGMSEEDLSLCLLKHATSKLSELSDLERLRSLGFRGEALASICAVAEVSLISKSNRDPNAPAFEISCFGASETHLASLSKVQKKTRALFLGRPHGSSIQVRGLFAHVPVRLKFLKTTTSEVAFVKEWLERIALSFPEVSFHLINQGKTILSLEKTTELERVHQILTNDEDLPCLFETAHHSECQVKAYWVPGSSLPHTRKVITSVNQRALKDRFLQQNLMRPFRGALLPGKFPALFIHCEIPPSLLDLNVHPTKIEIRFLKTQSVSAAIDQALSKLLSNRGATSVVPSQLSPNSSNSPETSYSSSQPNPWSSHQDKVEMVWEQIQTPESLPTLHSFSSDRPLPPFFNPPLRLTRERIQPEETHHQSMIQNLAPPLHRSWSVIASPSTGDQSLGIREGFEQNVFQWKGSFFDTFLAFEQKSGTQQIIWLDQHAAHERVRFEKLKKDIGFKTQQFLKYSLKGPPDSVDSDLSMHAQQLLSPISITLSQVHEFLDQKIDWLKVLGFDVEVFGEKTLLFRGVPLIWGTEQLKTRLYNLTQILFLERTTLEEIMMDEKVFELLALDACHGSIRAGEKLDEQEARNLIQELFLCENPWSCPHGRPVFAECPKKRLEEWFLRK